MPKENPITVYTMEYCPYCTSAKQLLNQRKIPFKEIVVPMDDDAQWEDLFKRSGMRTMPQIFHGDSLIGGYADLAKLDKKDQLKSLS